MNIIFSLVQVTAEHVVIKVNSNDNLTIAMNPYISGDYDYITVTRGANHTLTVVYKDGRTFSFSWGVNGYTLISNNLEKLISKVCEFISDNGIMLDDTSTEIRDARIYFNPNYSKWQLTVNDKGYYWSSVADSVDEMISEVSEKFNINASDWIRSKAITGISVWSAVL